jgi:hypothetical protein
LIDDVVGIYVIAGEDVVESAHAILEGPVITGLEELGDDVEARAEDVGRNLFGRRRPT